MGAYRLNGVDLETYGMKPGQADNSNIGLEGAWDMPARLGKCYYDWPDENGFEPYLRADEILFAGRDLALTVLMNTPSESEALATCYQLFDDIDAFTGLVALQTEFETYNVQIKDGIKAEYIADGWCKVRLPFRETIVDVSGIVPVADNLGATIDGISFDKMGSIYLDVLGLFERPTLKTTEVTAYGYEAYAKAKTTAREFTLKLLIAQPDYVSFNLAIKTTMAVFSAPGARTFRDKGRTAEFFLKDGWKLSSLYMQGVGYVATLDIKLIEIRVLGIWNSLADNLGNVLVTQNGQPLTELLKKN